MQYVWLSAQIDASGNAAEGRRIHMQMQLLCSRFYLQLYECSHRSSRISLYIRILDGYTYIRHFNSAFFLH